MRFVLLVLLLSMTDAWSAEPRIRDRDWVGAVVTQISEAERKDPGGERAGIVTIRVRIDADGALDGVSIDEGSGSAELDERAMRAVRSAAPFRSPPKKLLSLEGYTELSFPLQLEARSAKREKRKDDGQTP